jgi:molecular chaperone DnaK (HSP70)
MSDLQPRFVVGIDLGTTNSAVAFVDTSASSWKIEIFSIPQIVAAGLTERLTVLPSFHYEPAKGEFPSGSLRLPWHERDLDYVVGVFARDQGVVNPGRLVSSAKSWLCHGGVDRQAPLLPWHAPPEVTRISPVEASARYLRHIREAWDWQFPDAPLAQQQVVLTLPASFDEVARELTLRAAERAGLRDVTLIEEPQAAFYAWMYLQGDRWKEQVRPWETILVCDIGGGTTDFTLIRALPGKSGELRLERIAVGEHLILGGDNLDLALAYHLERRLLGDGRLGPREWGQLLNLCRRWKEVLLGEQAPEELTVHLPGAGGRLIGGGYQLRLTRQEIEELLVEGFFPRVSLDAEPARGASGFREFGLPYAPDPAVTRYLAAFLRAHRHAVEGAERFGAVRPDLVLFNGGVFESPKLRRRVLEVLQSWFRTPANPEWTPRVLEGDRLDLAVARGAAYYGLVRRGHGIRIGSGLPRSYYIVVGGGLSGTSENGALGQSPAEEIHASPDGSGSPLAGQMALCVVPAGLEPGDQVCVQEPRLELLLSQPVEFPLYVSTVRTTDRPGQLVPVVPEQLTPLVPLRTVLRTRKRQAATSVSVRLFARLTEIGTLDLWCAECEGKNSWKLQFDVRKSYASENPEEESSPERLAIWEESSWLVCERVLRETFGTEGTAAPEGVVKRLSGALGLDRDDWPATLLRRMWETLVELEGGRRKSPSHEARWLNLLGFVLRPGFGVPMDDWRVEETWRLLQGKLIFPGPLCRSEWFVMWRRIAGGLAAGWQQSLAEPLLGAVRNLARQLRSTGHGNLPFASHEAAEVWRLLGSLELLSVGIKAEIGTIILELLTKDKLKPQHPALIWALARIGARQPTYGPLNCVVAPEVVAEWLTQLLKMETPDPLFQLAVMQLARRTDDRYRDIPDRLRHRAAEWLRKRQASPHLVQLVLEGGKLEKAEQEALFGEKLPLGLRLASA